VAIAGDNLHIDAPYMLSRRRRLGDAVVTGLMWILYSYLWAPLISLIAWLLGFEFAYDVMVRAGGIHTLKEVLWWYGIVVACIFLVVAAWSITNRRRFGGHDRRQSGTLVSDDELKEFFELDDETLRRMQSARNIGVLLSEDGRVEQVYTIDVDRNQRNRRGQNDRSQIMNPASNAK
jgi:biofilm PGA synthesis protein PgaD